MAYGKGSPLTEGGKIQPKFLPQGSGVEGPQGIEGPRGPQGIEGPRGPKGEDATPYNDAPLKSRVTALETATVRNGITMANVYVKAAGAADPVGLPAGTLVVTIP